ncbi:SPOR domain-containing protein [Paucibacter sp. APW11]|uniref:SPOR domain-containing protein n=1 Tax=Roseateles aquae TaxID=3077235 RepID=A0ABU3P897_9BURK|nr:SPOR domain-containing protein [Paucibacter sp. APW11]MDT8998791.1 SPOR domain-containing protein [Paucibacter sp. APW11]
MLSFLKRSAAAPAAKPVSDSQDAVQTLRLRARRRLIGAAVLVGVGVIGFPLLFETQPRPIPVDLPIEIPRKEGAAQLPIPPQPQTLPAQLPGLTPPQVADSAETPGSVAQPTGRATEKVEPSAAEKPMAKPAERPAERASAKVAEKPSEKASDKVAEKSVDKAAEKAAADKAAEKARAAEAKAAEAARALALLEGRPVDKKASEPAAGARFIVQVGAYADGKAAQDARAKVEKQGLKTYTQAVDTADGKRTRVRVGPFASREEADRAAAKLRAAGISGVVLTL